MTLVGWLVCGVMTWGSHQGKRATLRPEQSRAVAESTKSHVTLHLNRSIASWQPHIMINQPTLNQPCGPGPLALSSQLPRAPTNLRMCMACPSHVLLFCEIQLTAPLPLDPFHVIRFLQLSLGTLNRVHAFGSPVCKRTNLA